MNQKENLDQDLDKYLDYAKFVEPQAQPIVEIVRKINRLDILRANGIRGLLEAIYNNLLQKEINYDREPYNPIDSAQRIRPCDEIFNQSKGTCIDLSLLFCGICLSLDLVPFLILYKDHALVAVLSGKERKEWWDYGEYDEFYNNDYSISNFFVKHRDEFEKAFYNNHNFIFIECTGYTKSNSLSQNVPEGRERDTNGFMTFDRAYQAGRDQFQNRSFELAIDIIYAVEELKIKPVKKFLNTLVERYSSFKIHPQHDSISLINKYIPIQISTERKYTEKDLENSWRSVQINADISLIYAYKGMNAAMSIQRDWVEVKQDYEEEAKKENKPIRIMVLADPGMGKSTLLKMEAINIAKKIEDELEFIPPNIETLKLPLFLKLSDFTQTQENEKIIETITKIIETEYPNQFNDIKEILVDKIEKGECLLLLDALDEVPSENLIALKTKLQAFFREYPVSVICTSRIVGYSGFFERDAKEVEIIPFDQRRIENFVKIWNLNDSEKFIEELKDKPQIRGLVQNPLLLSLICVLYQNRELILPTQRTKVYEQVVNYMLRSWPIQNGREPRIIPDIITTKLEFLNKIAYQTFCKDQHIFTEKFISKILHNSNLINRFQGLNIPYPIRELSQKDGILLTIKENSEKYLFLHLTFQEYFAASLLQELIEDDENHNPIMNYGHKYKWQEVFSLLGGIMKNPFILINQLMQQDQKSHNLFKPCLLLAGHCFAEYKSNPDNNESDKNLIRQIYQFWRKYPSDNSIRSTVIALGRVDLNMFNYITNLLEDPNNGDVELKREAIFVLGQLGKPDDRIFEVLKTAFQSQKLGIKIQAALALGEISTQNAIQELIHRGLAISDNWIRDIEIRPVLVKNGNEQVVKELISVFTNENTDTNIKTETAFTLADIASEEAIKVLINSLCNGDNTTKKVVISALRRINYSNFKEINTKINLKMDIESELIKIVHDEKSDVNLRKNAIEILVEMESSKVVSALKSVITNVKFSESASMVLAKIGNKEAVKCLFDNINNSNRFIASYIISSLIFIKNKNKNQQESVSVTELLQSNLNHQNSEIKVRVALALAKMGVKDEKLREKIEQVLITDGINHNSSELKWASAICLRKMNSNKGMKIIDEFINNNQHLSNLVDQRQKRLELSKIYLSKSINSNDQEKLWAVEIILSLAGTAEQVALTFKEIDNSQIIVPILVKMLKNECNFTVGLHLAKVLSHMMVVESVDAVNLLNNYLLRQDIINYQQEREEVFGTMEAALALAKIDSPQIIPGLIMCLHHKEPVVRQQCATALGQIKYLDNDNEDEQRQEIEEALISALKCEKDLGVKLDISSALENIANSETLVKLIQLLQTPEYENDRIIFSLARKLDVRYSNIAS
jgi:HEAT repeat protein